MGKSWGKFENHDFCVEQSAFPVSINPNSWGSPKKNFSKYIGLIQSWWGREEKKNKTKKMIRVSYETIPFAVIFACSHV
jgi:hypothetical protein